MGSDKVFNLGDYSFRAEELSALLLKQLKEDAEVFLGNPINEAVISVPAYFSDAQRKATKIAGQLAGLTVERLINEPTAAGIAYGLQEQLDDTNYLIFDLGGGTFDVSILNMFSGVIEVHTSKDKDQEANWLVTPKREFIVIGQFYWKKSAEIIRNWDGIKLEIL